MPDDPGLAQFRSERDALLREGNLVKAEATALEDRHDYDAAQVLWGRRNVLFRRYRQLLPEVPVSRNPDTGEVVRWAIDTVGLDGWFWSYRGASNRLPDPVTPGWLTMAGAVRLAEPVEPAPFLVRPGPGVPFVVPRILDAPGVRAVVAQVPVGRHTGWPITYFGPRPKNTRLVNLWPGDTYPVYDADGQWKGWAETTPWVADYDFDLAPWLRSGKLLWILPGDESMTLRGGVDGCPYLDLPGVRDAPFIEDGHVRYA